jgi:hypothetical protein
MPIEPPIETRIRTKLENQINENNTRARKPNLKKRFPLFSDKFTEGGALDNREKKFLSDYIKSHEESGYSVHTNRAR